MSFHHVCGSTDASAKDCHFHLGFEHEANSFYSLPTSRLLNGGSAASVTEWFWENVKLPHVQAGDRIEYTGAFDSDNGVMNFDNIVLQTRQRYTNAEK